MKKKSKKNNKFNIGDEIDFFIDNIYKKNKLDKKSWIRGKIKDIINENYIIEYFDYKDKKLSINNSNMY